MWTCERCISLLGGITDNILETQSKSEHLHGVTKLYRILQLIGLFKRPSIPKAFVNKVLLVGDLGVF